MYRVVKIGETDVPMLALASVDVYYKRMFKEDPLSIMTSKSADEGEKTRIAFGMGFIMAKYAENQDRKKMMALTYDEYLEWLDKFIYGDFIEAVPDILGLYYGQKLPTAKEKN